MMSQGGGSWMDEVGTPTGRNLTLEGRMASFEISNPHLPRDVRSQSFPEQGRPRNSAFSMFNGNQPNMSGRRIPQTSMPGLPNVSAFHPRSPDMVSQMPQAGLRAGALSRQPDGMQGYFGDIGQRRTVRNEADFIPRDSLYAVVEFKLFRAEVYQYPLSLERDISVGCLVLVEADRGTDLGFVAHLSRSSQDAIKVKRTSNKKHLNALMKDSATARQLIESGRIPKVPRPGSDSIFDDLNLFVSNDSFSQPPRNIIRLAESSDQQHLLVKEGYEAKAKRVCAQKASDFGLQMEILDAEAQIDGNKLTFYYYSDGYVTFNPLVQDLFKEFKTRIWLSAVNPASCYPQAPYATPSPGQPPWNAFNPSPINTSSQQGYSPPNTAALPNPPSPWNTSRYRRSTDIIGAHHVPPHLQPQTSFPSTSSSTTSSPASHRRSSSWNSANMAVGTPSPTTQPKTLASANNPPPGEATQPGQTPSASDTWQPLTGLGPSPSSTFQGGQGPPSTSSQVVSFYDFTNKGVTRYYVRSDDTAAGESPGESSS